jgi:hypothetical protein
MAIGLCASLGACGGNICWHDDSGLEPPPKESGIPSPHMGADAPSHTVAEARAPRP